MKKLSQHNLPKVIDLLNERLTFERAGVKLYDAIIQKIEEAQVGVPRLTETLRDHRHEEKEHEEWLEEQIRALGGDAHADTDLSLLVTAESRGIEEVIERDTDPLHLFHALLAAELVDNAGWDLLCQVADEAGDHDARREFKKRLHEEEDHLIFVRGIVERMANKQIFGAPAA